MARGGSAAADGRRGRKRMFESGELRLVLLKLIADEPRHGYELIKAIEELTEGEYAPSPGIVYPTLTMLADMGLIEEAQVRRTRKKVYEATDEGARALERMRRRSSDLDRPAGRPWPPTAVKGSGPPIGRAIGNLMSALRNRVTHEGWTRSCSQEITDILDDAAQRIERRRARASLATSAPGRPRRSARGGR